MSTRAAESNRLCIVTPMHSATQSGGAEYQIERLVDVLNSTGRYEIYYLNSVSDGDDSSDRYRVVRVGSDPRPPRFGYLCQALPLYKALEEIQPHAIYQRVACGYTGVCAYYAQRHGTNLVWHVAHDSDVSPDMSLDGRNPVRRFLEKRSVEYGIRRASRIVTQTTDQAALLERNYRRKADAVEEIALGLVAVLMGTFISTLNGRLSALGIADIRGAMHAGFDEGAWITTTQTVAQMLIAPIAVWAGTTYGPRRALLGAVDPIRVHEVEAELHRDETLLLYTDGVVDAGRPHRPLGERGLVELCRQVAGRPLGAMLERVQQ